MTTDSADEQIISADSAQLESQIKAAQRTSDANSTDRNNNIDVDNHENNDIIVNHAEDDAQNKDDDHNDSGVLSEEEKSTAVDQPITLDVTASTTVQLILATPREDILSPGTNTVLSKMEQINLANELDTRSMSGSRRSGSSDEARHTAASTSHQASPALDDDLELDTWTVWGELVKNWTSEYKKRPAYIRQLVRRGIPTHFRTIAWQLLAGSSESDALHEQYAEYMRMPSVHEKIIRRDIYRTYPEIEFFKDGARGQQGLLNVIKCYSVHDEEVGYCQGTAFIVGVLLMQMPEEQTFGVLLRLMEHYRLREIYKPAMTELGLCMFQLECIVQEQMPDLFTHFNNMGFDTSMYASSWFLTLFTTQLPMDLSNRVMDVFLSEGMEVIFRIAIAILQLGRFELLKQDMEGMLKYFQRGVNEMFDNDHELLFATAFKVTIDKKKMKRLEKDYMTKRTKEQEEAVELRRLRTECRLLRQRTDYLEKESEALADRLIRGQVAVAQSAEQTITVSHEFHKLRDMNNDVNRKLEDAYETIRELSTSKSINGTETATQVDDESMVEHIHALQQQIIETSAREADNEICIRDLKARLCEMEVANRRLKETPPDICVAALEEELISVKMREAEASLSLKEMRQRLAELEMEWSKFQAEREKQKQKAAIVSNGEPKSPGHESIAEHPSDSSDAEVSAKSGTESAPEDVKPPASTAKRFSLIDMMPSNPLRRQPSNAANLDQSNTVRELEEQMMGIRIRETDTLAELKEMRQKVMELETQNHVCTNQIRRQDEEYKRLKESHDEALESGKNSGRSIKEHQMKTVDVEAQLKEEQMAARLRESDLRQQLADLQQKLTDVDSKRLEEWTAQQLLSCDGYVDEDLLARSVSSVCSEGGDFQSMIRRMKVKVPSIDGTNSNSNGNSNRNSMDPTGFTSMLDSALVDQTIMENGEVLGVDSAKLAQNLAAMANGVKPNVLSDEDTDTPEKFGGN